MGKTIKYTKTSFNKKLKEIGRDDIELIGDYVNSKTLALFHCKVCGTDWYTYPIYFTSKRRNAKCPNCHKKEMKEELSLSLEEIKKKIADLNPNIEFIGEYKNYKTPIKLKCKIHGCEWEQSFSNFKTSPICPLCSENTSRLISGINDVASLRPDLLKYFKNSEDAKSIRPGSGKKVKLKCPECGYEKEISMCTLTEYGFSCPVCKDGISYPNKILRSLCFQLGYEFELEKFFNWSFPYKYDAYLKVGDNNLLIEMDGDYHSKNCLYFKTQPSDIEERDKLKDKLAKDNGYKLIRIGCAGSNFSFIKDNILKSELSKYINLKNIDWKKCGREAESSLVKEVCDFYNQNFNMHIKDIGKVFKLSKDTITKYLKRGYQIGLCKVYPGKKGLSKIISVFDKKGNLINTYLGTEDCYKHMKEDTGIEEITLFKLKRLFKSGSFTFEDFYFRYAKTLEDIADGFNKRMEEEYHNI